METSNPSITAVKRSFADMSISSWIDRKHDRLRHLEDRMAAAAKRVQRRELPLSVVNRCAKMTGTDNAASEPDESLCFAILPNSSGCAADRYRRERNWVNTSVKMYVSHEVSSSASNRFVSLRSAVSKPSLNRSYEFAQDLSRLVDAALISPQLRERFRRPQLPGQGRLLDQPVQANGGNNLPLRARWQPAAAIARECGAVQAC